MVCGQKKNKLVGNAAKEPIIYCIYANPRPFRSVAASHASYGQPGTS